MTSLSIPAGNHMRTGEAAALRDHGEVALRKPRWASELPVLFVIAAQLAALLYIVRAYNIDGRPFRLTLALASGGFLVNHWLPQRWKLPFFAVLSVGALALATRPVDAAIITGVGLVLIGLCHLPIPLWGRVSALLAAAGVLAALRAELFPAPWMGAPLTILGSMFMFKLIVYAYDLSTGAPKGLWRGAAYFFMLPNACFPLFPIVDYRTFCRTGAVDNPLPIYQTGVKWILRGIIHLLLLRTVNALVVVEPSAVADAGDLFLYIIVLFCGYLQVSGTFHVIVGMLHLFGFALPETHHWYVFASSITDFWRRINIYWKDFIQKVVFYPIYFRLKRLGRTRATVWATALAMIITWAFHSYQWFWLKGEALLTGPDIAFWGILGALLTVNVWFETAFSHQHAKSKADRSLAACALTGLKTVLTMSTILILWCMWSAESFAEWFALMAKARNYSVGDLVLIATSITVFGVMAAAASWFEKGRALTTGLPNRTRAPRPGLGWIIRSAAPVGAVCAVIALASVDTVQARLGSSHLKALQLVLTQRLTADEEQLLERGYYENLTNASRLSPQLRDIQAQIPADWPGQNPVRPTGDWMNTELTPSGRFDYMMAVVSTNRWGMRDREYDKAKPPGVFRIGIFGESHSMGAGVNDAEVYEQVAEEMLAAAATGKAVEILNFSVNGYGPLSKLGQLERKGLEFDLDVAIETVVMNDNDWAVRELARMVRSGQPLPYPEMAELATKAGVTARMSDAEAESRIRPHTDELLRMVYARFSRTSREHAIRPYVMLLPQPRETFRNHDEAFARWAKIAQEEGAEVLDISSAFATVDTFPTLWVAPWDRHPNAAGHRMLATSFVQVLNEEVLATRYVSQR